MFAVISLVMLTMNKDRFVVMGWDMQAIDFAGIPDRKLNSLVGEALHLGCVGLVMYLIFLTEAAPWWTRNDQAPPPGSGKAAPQVTEAHDVHALPAKRQRRTGCLVPHKSV